MSSLTPDYSALYQAMYRIRFFEELVLEEFSRGVFHGTTHPYLGQEANAVGVLSQRGQDDLVISNHRSHGHFLAYGGSPYRLFAELMGKAGGVCGGRGGSQHLYWKNFYSNGVLGGTLPLATGMALAEKFKNSGSIAIVFMGDGSLGEGVVYESLNMASLWDAPILFVVENNRIAQTTPIETALAGNIASRFQAFGIPTSELASSDVLEIQSEAAKLISATRLSSRPYALILNTYRFGPHSKGDDTRLPQELERIKHNFDPLKILGVQLDVSIRSMLEDREKIEILAAFEQALAEPDLVAPTFLHGSPDGRSVRA